VNQWELMAKNGILISMSVASASFALDQPNSSKFSVVCFGFFVT
jgi:hypothetical protein